jgi:pimeloyl-ACP methyl ester carboxylesterase
MENAMLNKIIATIAAALALGHATAADAPAFRVDVTGKGAPIILIPGLGSGGDVWDGTVGHYCADGKYQCHVLTLAGFAGQPAIAEPLLPAVERQLSAYITANRFDHPVVIGHSLGGFVGMQLAAYHPEQVGKLIIVDTLPALAAAQMPSATPAQLKEMAAGMRANLQGQDPATFKAAQMKMMRTMITRQEDIDRALVRGGHSDRATVIDAMTYMTATDLRQDISRIEAPTLVLGTWIAYKDYAPKAAITSVFTTQYAQLKGAKIEIADTARHFIMYDDPAWMYDRIDNFLN